MNKMTDPIIEQIEKMVEDIHGWSPIDQLYTLFNLAYLASDIEGDIVEIGSWGGRSASVLGLAAQLIGNTVVHCIDLFPDKDSWKENQDGTYSFEIVINNTKFDAYKEQTVWKEPYENQTSRIYEKYNSVWDCFMETIEKNNMKDILKPHRGTSGTFIQTVNPDFKCKMVFIDADHGYDAVCRDIKNMEPYIVEGGWICFDDAFSCYEGLNKAVNELIIENPSYIQCQQMTRKCFIARKSISKTKNGR